MDRTITISGILLVAVIVGAAFAFAFTGDGAGTVPQGSTSTGSSKNVTVYFFYGEECPHCHTVMPLVHSLEQKYPGVEFLYLETWHNLTNYAVYATLNRELKVSRAAVPEVIVGNVVLIGEKDIPDQLEQAIAGELKKKN